MEITLKIEPPVLRALKAAMEMDMPFSGLEPGDTLAAFWADADEGSILVAFTNTDKGVLLDVTGHFNGRFSPPLLYKRIPDKITVQNGVRQYDLIIQ